MLAGMWSPNSASDERLRVEEDVAVRARGGVDRVQRVATSVGEARRSVSMTIAPVGDRGWSRRPRRCAPGRRSARFFGVGGAEQVEAEVGVDAARATALLEPSSRVARDADVGDRPGRPSGPGRSGRGRATWRPSSSAAMPRICATVTTPVPPMPVMRIVAVVVGDRASPARAARPAALGDVRAWPCSARDRRSGTTGSRPPGRRSPCCRRPGGSASCGRTRSRPAARDRQLDFSPQSPQPSQTRSLMRTRCGGVGDLAALAQAALLGRAAPGRGSGR